MFLLPKFAAFHSEDWVSVMFGELAVKKQFKGVVMLEVCYILHHTEIGITNDN